MASSAQKAKAERFRELHHGPSPLLLPNAWDGASAALLQQAGFQAIATTSSGAAASLGFPDGEYISREMLVDAVKRMTRVISVPLSVDLEAGYGATISDVLETVRAIIEAGAIGINIEDSTKNQQPSLVDVSYQVELLQAVRELASALDMPLVINARTDVFLLPDGEPADRFEEAVRRLNAYRDAGADCLFPIGAHDKQIIANLVQALQGPVNIMGGPPAPTLPELAQLGVARVSMASGLMRATLGRLRRVARELLEQGTYEGMTETISTAELRGLFPRPSS